MARGMTPASSVGLSSSFDALDTRYSTRGSGLMVILVMLMVLVADEVAPVRVT